MSTMEMLPEQVYYGCVFCRTTREKLVAQALEELYQGLKATAVSQIKHRSQQGRKYTEEQILLPGYVLFRSEADIPAESIRFQNVIKLLRNLEGSWHLRGSDRSFAEFVFEHNGVLGLSQARNLGDRVTMTDGPLKAMQGNIVKIDRRNRNGLVEFSFDDRVWRVWLAFELVD